MTSPFHICLVALGDSLKGNLRFAAVRTAFLLGDAIYATEDSPTWSGTPVDAAVSRLLVYTGVEETDFFIVDMKKLLASLRDKQAHQ
jgi:hypothetical protein